VTETRAVRADDLYRLRLITDPQISPDGRRVAFVLSQMDQEKDDYVTNIYLVDREGEVRQLSQRNKDGGPRWSPDGRSLAFLSDRRQPGVPQLYLLPLSGGEAMRVTDHAGGVAYPEWSPDGAMIAYLARDDEISPDELDACARAQRVELAAGDIVLIRTGWLRVFEQDRALFDSGAPGPNGDVANWFKHHDLCALGADNVAVEAFPPRAGGALPLHIGVIRNLGGYLIELLYLEELAAARVHEFLFFAAPLRPVSGIGSHINPLPLC